MKKFTKILICLILCVFGVGLIGCGDKRTPEEKAFTYPTKDALVRGNGGLAVQKGNYIYFANGYKAVADSTRYGKFTHGGVMLAKLTETGELVVDENGAIVDDNLIHISNKLAGFEATDLTIFGDYLYFTSPCQEDDSDTEEWASGLVDFNRIKLDKSSEVERIYQSNVNNDKLEFKYYENNGKVSLLIYETENKKLIKVGTNKEDTTIASNVTDVHFADNYNEVFYVVSTSNTSVPYQSYKLDAVSGSKTEFAGHAAEAKVEFVENGFAYIVESDNLYRYNLLNTKNNQVVLNGYSSYSTVKVAPGENLIIAISTEDSGMIFEYYENGSAEPSLNYVLETATASVNVVGFVNGSIIYHDGEGNVKSLSYANRNSGATIQTIATVSDMSTTYFDIDGSYLYFYKTIGSNEYLHRLRLDNGTASEEFVGVYLEADIPETEETTEE